MWFYRAVTSQDVRQVALMPVGWLRCADSLICRCQSAIPLRFHREYVSTIFQIQRPGCYIVRIKAFLACVIEWLTLKIRGEGTVHQLCPPPNRRSWAPEFLMKREVWER